MASPFKDDQPLDAPPSAGSREVHGRTSRGQKPYSDGDAHASAGRFEEALVSYRSALGRQGLASSDVVYLKRKMAVTLQSLARWEEALANLDEARVLASRDHLLSEEAQILVEYGKIHFVKGEMDKALECSIVAHQKAVDAEDLVTQGYADNVRGSVLFRRGRLDDSATSFERALQSFKRAGNLKALCLAYNNLGLVYKNRCQWKRSLEYFQVAANLLSIEGDELERRKGLHNLGIVHIKLGQLAEASACFEEALALSRSFREPLAIIRALLGTASVALVTGDHARAKDSLEQALELCSGDSYPRETALTHRSLGMLHLAMGDMERARRCYETAWKRAVEVAPEGDLATELLMLRAELALKAGRPREAQGLAERSLALAVKAGDRYAAAEVHRILGGVARSLADLDGAESHYNDGVTALRGIEAPYPLALVLLDQGRLGVERMGLRHDTDRVVTLLEEALRIFRQLGVSRYRGEALLALARAHLKTGSFDRASSHLNEATEMFRSIGFTEGLAAAAAVQNEIEGRFAEESVSHLNEFRATNRIQEILDSRVETMAKIGQIVDAIAGAVDADGALLVTAPVGANDEPVAFRRMSPPMARSLVNQLARCIETGITRPHIILNTESCGDPALVELARRHAATSLILIPISWDDGRSAVLYLDRTRSGRNGAFRQSNLNLGVVLSSYLSDLFTQNDRDARISENLALKKQLEERIALADVVTQNREMLQILRLVEKINRSNLTVLLQGETGTGKTLIARALHLSSPRAREPFITVDCAALPENLLESELFGYMRGSFTGATQDKKGLFEEADGGTIFLDEIGRAGLSVQRRLLHLLDKGEVRPVGSNTYRKLDVRVICATSSKDLKDDVSQGGFIKDLYYRLNDISIIVPPLRERVEDIPLLAEYFLDTFVQGTKQNISGISRAAMTRLLRYNWPGNVRELEKVIRRACILVENDEPIGLEHLPEELLGTSAERERSADTPAGLHDTVEETERRLVLKALEENNWNKSRAAIALGLSRKGLKNKIVRYGLDRRLIS